MQKLLIEQTPTTTRTAITENNKLKELYIDNHDESQVGNIIVGRVRTIMPGQFAFIDIGRGKNAFANLKQNHNIKSGQPLLVQVQKNATTTKGAYVSTEITLKGWLIILQKHQEVGVSHKITDEKETRRLKKLVRGLLPGGYGAIVRTNAKGATSEALQEEITILYRQYEEILQRAEFAMPPAKLHPSISISPILNDLICETLDEIHISGTVDTFAATKEYIGKLAPSLKEKIFHHTHEDKLFDRIKKQINAALEKTVPLPCGGFITIEQTEACAVIDVNTGNNTSSYSYRETILHTNLEAAVTIIDQIILRNLSGIIIIDFIDMTRQEDKTTLMTTFTKEAGRDRLNPEIIGLSPLGIVQMARPKRRLPLSQILKASCPHCGK